ncbi:MAG: DUF47 family protein [Desulfobacterales bacterium]|jgi:predicted phosphate transport protein (TIGR00153 family)
MIFKKEKEVIGQIDSFLDEMGNCLMTSEKTILLYLQDEVKEAKRLAREVRRIETQADVKRYEIRDNLYQGAYLPGMREDIYHIVERIDKVANAAEACCNFFLNQRPGVTADLKPHFASVTREAFGVRMPLKDAALCFFDSDSPMDEIRQYTQQVSLIESDVDKSEWDLTKLIFTSSLDRGHKMHLKQCLDSIVEVSDRAEDASDQLELAALKSTA